MFESANAGTRARRLEAEPLTPPFLQRMQELRAQRRAQLAAAEKEEEGSVRVT